MDNYILKYIKTLKKNNSSKEKISVLLIVVLLILQIMITFFVCRYNNFSNFNNFVTQAVSSQLTNEENRKENFSAIAAAITSNAKVLRISEKENPSYMDLVEPCSEIRKLKAVLSIVSNIYVYNDKYGYIYDAYGKCYSIDDKAVEKIKIGIDCYFDKNEAFFMYSEPSHYNPENIFCFDIFRSASNRRELIIFEKNTKSMFKEYKSIQNTTESNMIVTTDGGMVIYGGEEFSSMDDISDTEVFKATRENDTYNIVNYNSEKYLVCHTHSDKTKRRYITMIPVNKVAVGFLYGKNYFALYICIILSILVLLRTLSIWRGFYRLFIGITDIEKKRNTQNVMIYSECGIPNKEGNEKLANYLHSRFEKPYFVAILMIIDNYDELKEQYSSKDMELIKYGLNNIFNEIFEKYEFIFQPANDAKDRFEFIVAIDAKHQIRNIKKALLDCQKAFDEYIGMVCSFCIGSAESRSNLYRSYSLSQNLTSYLFVYGSHTMIDESSVLTMGDEEFDYVKLLCDRIITDIIDSSDDYIKDMSQLKESLVRTSPSQCYELLSYLLFNICSTIKNIEKKYNVENMIDIGECFKTLSSAKYSAEMLQIIELLYYDIQSILPNKNNSKYEKIIDDCNKIIEDCYKDANLSIDYIADKIGFSRGHLTRIYKQITGISISAKIADYRLDVAAKLLIGTDKKVSDIVNEVGYVNSSHFTVTFKQKFGESPLNYRKRHDHK